MSTIRYRRGKPTPEIKHHDRVDLTTWPLNSSPDGRPIRRCPKCGRKGEWGRDRAGNESYTHVKEYQTMFWMVREACHVKASEVVAS